MTNVRNYTDEELLKRVEGLPSFKGWKKGIYDIWVASKKDAPNKMDDKVYTFECKEDGKRPVFVMKCTGTANPGTYGLKNFKKWNNLGCAVALRDYIGYNTHVYGKHGVSQYYAYIQTFTGTQYPYTRDNNLNEKSENYGKIYWDRIGMNCHRAGEHTVDINGNSIACLVRNVRKEYDTWMQFMNKRPLSVCVLNEF